MPAPCFRPFRAPAATILIVFLLALLATGCAKTDVTVPLGYSPIAAMPGKCDKRVAVLTFTDERPASEASRVGDREGEIFFYPGQSPTDWATRALAEELTLSGCVVERHDRAYAFDADWVVTGALERVYLKQTSLLDYDGKLKLRVRLERARGGQSFTKEVSAGRQVTNLPSGRERAEILTGLMQDAMRDAAPFLIEKMR